MGNHAGEVKQTTFLGQWKVADQGGEVSSWSTSYIIRVADTWVNEKTRCGYGVRWHYISVGRSMNVIFKNCFRIWEQILPRTSRSPYSKWWELIDRSSCLWSKKMLASEGYQTTRCRWTPWLWRRWDLMKCLFIWCCYQRQPHLRLERQEMAHGILIRIIGHLV